MHKSHNLRDHKTKRHFSSSRTEDKFTEDFLSLDDEYNNNTTYTDQTTTNNNNNNDNNSESIKRFFKKNYNSSSSNNIRYYDETIDLSKRIENRWKMELPTNIWIKEEEFEYKPNNLDELLNNIIGQSKTKEESKKQLKESKKKKKKDKKRKKEDDEENKKKKKKKKKKEEEEQLAGPKLFNENDSKDSNYKVPLLPGEGAAIAEYIQQDKRIPRRGEVGLTSNEIKDFENLGYVMSGSRHARMNAIRIMKENEVYMQEEKKRLELLNKQEKRQRENKVISQFRDLVAKEKEK
ncbi:hypothetical protein ABK040_003449 [Willaertia magna]